MPIKEKFLKLLRTPWVKLQWFIIGSLLTSSIYGLRFGLIEIACFQAFIAGFIAYVGILTERSRKRMEMLYDKKQAHKDRFKNE